MAKAFVALGSNLKEPIQQVNHALAALSALPNTTIVKASSLYQTAPIGYTNDQLATVPDFINAVAELKTTLSPIALLDAILDIEDKAGRVRPYPNAPRVLDCDLLMHGDVVMETNQLTLPHPRMHLRGFVLLPLIEIAPQLFIPNRGKIESFITPEITEGVIKLNANQNA